MEKTVKCDILIVGHYSYDSIVLHGTERKQAGGAVYYCAFPLKSLSCSLIVSTKIQKKDSHLLSVFTESDILVLPTYESKSTTVTEINYPTENMDKREMKVLSFADPFDAKRDIPNNIHPKWVHLGALYAGEMSLEFVKDMRNRFGEILSVDIQGFIRKVNEKKEIEYIKNWEEKWDVLKHISILKVDRKEAEILTEGEKNLKVAIKKISDELVKNKGVIKEILCTSTDGVLVYDCKSNEFYSSPFKNEKIIGRTGRGDTTIASYLGCRIIKNMSMLNSCTYCAAVVSMKMEKTGPFKESFEEIEKFVKKNY